MVNSDKAAAKGLFACPNPLYHGACASLPEYTALSHTKDVKGPVPAARGAGMGGGEGAEHEF